jgi:nucleoside 2-deoxyribosyltransferase
MNKEEILEILLKIKDELGELDKKTVSSLNSAQLEDLRDDGYIRDKRFKLWIHGSIEIQKGIFTEKAIQLIEQSQISLSSSNSKICFVAMWFSDQMLEFRTVVKEAIEACGYQATIIDEKLHNNNITIEIFQAIDQCHFMIADFTGQRGGVYYEAGYAKGLGKQVIHCIRADSLSDLHFDTKQINHLTWCDDNLSQFKEKLIAQIKNTIQ